MFCDKCEKKESCTKLCSEAEQYANQDYVGVKRSVMTTPDIHFAEHGDLSTWMDDNINIHMSKREKQVVTLISMRLTRKEICQVLDISNSALKMCISRLRKKGAKM